MCGAAFIIMLLYLIFIDGVDNLLDSVQQIRLPFLILALGCMLIYWLFEAVTVHISIKALYKGQSFKKRSR